VDFEGMIEMWIERLFFRNSDNNLKDDEIHPQKNDIILSLT